MELLVAATIVFGAMVVRGFTGFGGALLMVPLLGLVWDVRFAIVLVAFIQLVTGLMLVAMSRRAIDRPTVVPVLIWSVIGLAVGSYLLASLPVDWIARIVGVAAIAIGVVSLVRRVSIAAEPSRQRQVVVAGVGSSAGLLHGLIGTSGPVIVPYLQRVLSTPASMRATLLVYFLVLDGLRIGGYLQLGLIEANVLQWAVVLVPVAIVGSLAGARIHVQVSDNIFRIAVALLLIVAGGLLLV